MSILSSINLVYKKSYGHSSIYSEPLRKSEWTFKIIHEQHSVIKSSKSELRIAFQVVFSIKKNI